MCYPFMSRLVDDINSRDWKYYVRNLDEGSCLRQRRRRSEVDSKQGRRRGKIANGGQRRDGRCRRRLEEGWEVVDVERGQEEGKWLDKKKGKEKK